MEEDAHELLIGDLDPAVIVPVDLAKSLCELLDYDASAEGRLDWTEQGRVVTYRTKRSKVMEGGGPPYPGAGALPVITVSTGGNNVTNQNDALYFVTTSLTNCGERLYPKPLRAPVNSLSSMVPL